MDTDALIGQLQRLLNSREVDVKRLLVEPTGPKEEVQCDVVRIGKKFQCHLRLRSSDDSKVCIFEAQRVRKGRLRNPEYRIALPAADPRMLPAGTNAMSAEARDAALRCGRLRSYLLRGAVFVAYDDGAKPGKKAPRAAVDQTRLRRQMAALSFHKTSSVQNVPLMMRMLVPAAGTTSSEEEDQDGDEEELQTMAQRLQTMAQRHEVDAAPPGTSLLRVVPPRWNAESRTFHVAFAGRARCTSNKNMQLADVSKPNKAALQMGKLKAKEYNLDFGGCISPFQAFAAALSIFDQSSVLRRF